MRRTDRPSRSAAASRDRRMGKRGHRTGNARRSRMETRDASLQDIGAGPMDIEFDDTLQGLGRGGHRIMIWDGQAEQHIEAHRALRSRDIGKGVLYVLKSEKNDR